MSKASRANKRMLERFGIVKPYVSFKIRQRLKWTVVKHGRKLKLKREGSVIVNMSPRA